MRGLTVLLAPWLPTFDRLDDAQRSILVRAASQTRDGVVASLPDDAEAARTFCASGGAVVLADEGEAAALEEPCGPCAKSCRRTR